MLQILVIVVLILLLHVVNLAIRHARPVLPFQSQLIKINARCAILPAISQLGDATAEILKM